MPIVIPPFSSCPQFISTALLLIFFGTEHGWCAVVSDGWVDAWMGGWVDIRSHFGSSHFGSSAHAWLKFGATGGGLFAPPGAAPKLSVWQSAIVS
jgi:hypothetical protein